MERLTERTSIGILVKEDYGEKSLKNMYLCNGGKPNTHYTNCDEGYCAMEKLADYEDAEEHGLLLRLPCKVGDKLYYIDSYYNVVVLVRLNEVIIQFVGINNYTYQYNCCSFDECGDTYEEYEFNNNDFGKTVFLTREEAEAKLKEMECNND